MEWDVRKPRFIMKKTFFVCLSFIFLFSFAVFAQNGEAPQSATPEEAILAINIDENVEPKDLGVKESGILPDSRLYFFKEWGRGLRSVFVFDEAKKADLRIRFANERLMEAKKLAEKTRNVEAVGKALDKYEKELEKAEERIKIVKDDGKDIGKILEKFADSYIKAQKTFDKMEKEMPEGFFGEVSLIKSKAAKNFADSVLAVETPEQFEKLVVKMAEAQKGSEFRHFKNLEVLKRVGEQVPEAARLAIQNAQKNILKQMAKEVGGLSQKKAELFREYVKASSGESLKHLEIIDELEREDLPLETRVVLGGSREASLEKLEQKLKKIKDSGKDIRGFLISLEKGDFEGLRIIDELEKDISPEFTKEILEIKNEALKSFAKNLKEAEKNPEVKENILKEAARMHDLKQFKILKENEAVLSEGAQKMFMEIEREIKQEAKKEFEGIKDPKIRRIIAGKLAGENPEELVFIGDFTDSSELGKEIFKLHTKNIEEKMERIKDAEEFKMFKERIEKEEMFKKEIRENAPELFKKLEEKNEIIVENLRKENVSALLDKTAVELSELKQIFEKIKELAEKSGKTRQFESLPVLGIIERVEERIDESKKLLGEGKTGNAFGMANSSRHQIVDAINMLKKFEFAAQNAPGVLNDGSSAKDEILRKDCRISATLDAAFKARCEKEGGFIKKEIENGCVVGYECERRKEDIKPFLPINDIAPKKNSPTMCFSLWNPVCGTNKKTYSNECFAEKAGVKIARKGECEFEEARFEEPRKIELEELKEKILEKNSATEGIGEDNDDKDGFEENFDLDKDLNF